MMVFSHKEAIMPANERTRARAEMTGMAGEGGREDVLRPVNAESSACPLGKEGS